MLAKDGEGEPVAVKKAPELSMAMSHARSSCMRMGRYDVGETDSRASLTVRLGASEDRSQAGVVRLSMSAKGMNVGRGSVGHCSSEHEVIERAGEHRRE